MRPRRWSRMRKRSLTCLPRPRGRSWRHAMRSFGSGVRDGVRKLFSHDIPSPSRSRNSLRSEIAAHVDARVDYLVARGVYPEDARREAIDRFGGDMNDALGVLEASAIATQRRL